MNLYFPATYTHIHFDTIPSVSSNTKKEGEETKRNPRNEAKANPSQPVKKAPPLFECEHRALRLIVHIFFSFRTFLFHILKKTPDTV